MTAAARKLLEEILALPEDERLELASRILASVHGPEDEEWATAWLAELDRRTEAARAQGNAGAEWSEVRSRVLQRLGRT
jgi:putative addiction module component (TIGR02574 family)